MAYAQREFSGLPGRLELPAKAPRPQDPHYTPARASMSLPESLAAALEALAHRLGLPVIVPLLAGWAALLGRWSGQDDLLIGVRVPSHCPAPGEPARLTCKRTVGVRCRLHGEPTVRQFLGQMKSGLRKAASHQDGGFEGMVEDLRRSAGSIPDLQATIALEAMPSGEAAAADRTKSTLELALSLAQSADGLVGTLDYASELFAPETIERLLAGWEAALGAIAEDICQPVGSIPVMPEAEQRRVLHEFNATAVDYPRETLIHELFEEQVRRTPGAVAVEAQLECGECSLTFAELNARANRLAWHLRSKGARPDCPVGLHVNRGADMIVGLLGVLKAGGAYVPLDPGYPPERLAFILADASPRVVITQESLRPTLSQVAADVVSLDGNSIELATGSTEDVPAGDCGLNSSNLAYILYTSGSTGSPKGVAVEHRNVVNVISWAHSVGAPAAFRHMLQSTSLNFDLSVYECFVPLCFGGCIHVVDSALSLTGASVPVTLINTVPSAMRALLEARAVPMSTQVVNLAGEAVAAELVERIFASTAVDAVWNLYGPTETTVYSSALAMSRRTGFVPTIGRPIANTRIYILDRRLQPLPIGVTGEIFIAGAGVARGYLHRPELTAARFRPDPFDPHADARMYKTGDLGRWREDGMIEYLGRNDGQVKVRGFRIELGEIETGLKRLDGIKEAAVVARDDAAGDKRLVAYVVPQRPGEIASVEDWRECLQAALPQYMVPGAFVMLERLPLTPNGKLDRRSLPAPDYRDLAIRAYEPPQGSAEEALAIIWEDLLRVARVGRNDNFFELGGHSLLIVQMIERLRQAGLAIEAGAAFAGGSLAELAAALHSHSFESEEPPPNLIPEGCEAITPQMLPLVRLEQAHIDRITRAVPGGARNVQDIYPLAPLQEGVLFHHLLEEQRADPYVLVLSFSLPSAEEAQRFIRALQAIIDRHDALRTAIFWDGLPCPVQVVLRTARLLTDTVELTPDCSVTDAVANRMLPEHQRLDLHHAPLMRLQIVPDRDGERHFALLRMHHIACDHEAIDLLLAELRDILAGREHELAQPTPYRNYVAQVLERGRQRDAASFFRERLADVSEPTAPFGLMEVHGGGRTLETASHALDPGLAERLRNQARALGVSLATVFHAVWALVVAGTSNRDDVVFGTVLSGRLQGTAGGRNALGMFINTLPLRVVLGDLTARGLVQQAHRELIALLHHGQASLAPAQRCSGLDGAAPVFTTLLNYFHGNADSVAVNRALGQGAEFLELREWTNYPIALSIDDRGRTLVLTAQSDRRIGATRILDHVREASESLCLALEGNPGTMALELDTLPDSERRQVLDSFNRTAVEYDTCRVITQLFEEQVRLRPDSVALECGPQRLTYRELNAKANQIAHALRARGVRPDGRVALCLPRGIDFVAGMLGTLKAGGAYVPLDTAYPVARIATILENCTPVALLAELDTERTLPVAEVSLLHPDGREVTCQSTENIDRTEVGLGPDHLAYVIYTSGSTGTPKGVMVEHRSLLNLVHWHCETFQVRPGTRCSCMASVAFDAAAWEIWPTLCAGASLVIAPRELTRDPEALLAWWAGQAVEVSFLTTPLAEIALARDLHSRGLRTLLIGGDRLRRHPGARSYQVVNNYGPTETTVVATSGAVLESDPVLHIGRPLANTRVYILDRHLKAVPVGVTGEIYIGGAGVARGYLNCPDLTCERFVTDPFFEGGASMYRTGDLARWRPDGSIEFLGRNDDQVKIRGYRIELGEIESRLALHAGLRESLVIAREQASGETRIVAYLVPREGHQVNVERLRRELRAALPEYMVPASFVTLDRLPLTPNGKVDRHALPAPESAADCGLSHEPPEGGVEETLAAIWEQLLPVERVGRDDDFFELGGHSLLATQMILRVRDSLVTSISMKDIFNYPTLRRFAERLEELRSEQLLVRLAASGQNIDSLLERWSAMSESEARECIRQLNTGLSP
ncbi:MAG: amino acid adenylation domain-containing protein [Steroidobacteraceae bacterium]